MGWGCNTCATGWMISILSAYLWFGWIIRRTPGVPCAMPVRASCGPRTGIFNVFHIIWDPYGARAWPASVPYGTLTDTQGIDKIIIGKIPHGRRIWPYGSRAGPTRAVHGLITIPTPGARKLIMHALKLYGSRTGRQNSYGAARGPWVNLRFLFKTAREQPRNSPYGTQECDVTQALGSQPAIS